MGVVREETDRVRDRLEERVREVHEPAADRQADLPLRIFGEREQALVEAQIRDALDLRPSPRNRLLELVNTHARECDAVLLACTDLSRDMLAELDAVAVFDSLECLSVAAARRVASAAVQPGARECEVHDGG